MGSRRTSFIPHWFGGSRDLSDTSEGGPIRATQDSQYRTRSSEHGMAPSVFRSEHYDPPSKRSSGQACCVHTGEVREGFTGLSLGTPSLPPASHLHCALSSSSSTESFGRLCFFHNGTVLGLPMCL